MSTSGYQSGSGLSVNVHEAYYEVVWRRDSNTARMSADFFGEYVVQFV